MTTRPMTNAEVAATFVLLADLLEIHGESSYKVLAYRRAADGITQESESVAALRQRGALKQIPGVGQEIAQKITDLLDTGSFRLLDQAKADIPPGVATLLRVPGLGPKRARLLYESLGIDSLDALRAALDEGRVARVAGVGAKTAEHIGEGLKSLHTDDNRLPLGTARPLGLRLIEQLRERAPSIRAIELAGSIRRFRETIGDLDIVAAAPDPSAVVQAFVSLPMVANVEMSGENRCRVLLDSGFGADLWVLPEAHWGSLLLHVTGNKHHDIRLRDMALERGRRLSEYGLTRDGRLTTCATEEEAYRELGLQWIPPPMRQGAGEIDLAMRGELPAVIELRQLRGDMHTHSEWSDGTRSIREMALAARARGYEYLCLTDHSQGLGVAHGLTPERLRQHRVEIDSVNVELAPFRVLQGTELEVRADGSLDYDDEILASLDIVIASVHSQLQQDRERITERALAAIRHPLVDILAHPTGRIVGGRRGGDFEMEALYAEAARTGTVLEIDGDPGRLDLRDVHARAAITAGCIVSIDSDAHSVEGLANVFYGVGTAQRAWVPPERVLNTLPLDAMLARLKRNQRQSG
jgi:DNA polymerase (family 10)